MTCLICDYNTLASVLRTKGSWEAAEFNIADIFINIRIQWESPLMHILLLHTVVSYLVSWCRGYRSRCELDNIYVKKEHTR